MREKIDILSSKYVFNGVSPLVGASSRSYLSGLAFCYEAYGAGAPFTQDSGPLNTHSSKEDKE